VPALTGPVGDERAYVECERSILAMLATRHPSLDPDSRRDLYHEAWASVLKRRSEGIAVENLRAYLLGAADKLASKRVYGADARRRQTFDPTSEGFVGLADVAELPEERALAADEARRLHMLVDELEDTERALFIALGGTSYAVAINSIGTKQIKNNSVRSSDVRNGTLSSRDIKGGKVARAGSADRVGGKSAKQLRVSCPSGTFPTMGVCIETSARPAAPYGSAKVACEIAGRRLPSHQELVSATDSNVTLSSGGELTSSVYPKGDGPDLQVLIITTPAGSVGLVPDRFDGARQFRCIAYRSN
jgi:DNA-directed RNA polymerase specialized sigma24 family protein